MESIPQIDAQQETGKIHVGHSFEEGKKMKNEFILLRRVTSNQTNSKKYW